jgi:hypothetical protein
MKTSVFFGKMPMASRSQKKAKFAPFSVCPRAADPRLGNTRLFLFEIELIYNLFAEFIIRYVRRQTPKMCEVNGFGPRWRRPVRQQSH